MALNFFGMGLLAFLGAVITYWINSLTGTLNADLTRFALTGLMGLSLLAVSIGLICWLANKRPG